ncbi:hypothetical protein [Cohnella terricola]|uniref:Uncharacterized protein n=1 Tax=Cohnella terricola TaxID=1289167 RepID=A0A559JIM2_9BACL|nr:hypothetical protein [Cohnella terricola]TVX99722.1 hypothetical protein FPZ45_12255 [Cohnella terricola]
MSLLKEDKYELLARVSEVERSLGQKADEVVSAQVRQHRAELDELRRSVAELFAIVETLQGRAASAIDAARREEIRLSVPDKPVNPTSKRKLYRTFF